MTNNRQQVVKLARRPHGKPQCEDFEIVDADVPTPGEGEILIQTLYLSVDPGMRGMMEESKPYGGFAVGQPLTGRSVGRVVISHHPVSPRATTSTSDSPGSITPFLMAGRPKKSTRTLRHCPAILAWSACRVSAPTSA